MRVVISASVAGSNRLKEAPGGKMESFLSAEGEESYCVDVGRRVCNERRRDETLFVKKDGLGFKAGSPVSTGILPHSLPEWAFRARPGLWRNCLCRKVARISEHIFGGRYR